MPSFSTVPSDSPDRRQDGHPPAVSDALLQARGLTFRVEARTLWRDLDLTLRGAARLGISGPSGSGKTLLLRTLAGLEPLQAGELMFQGRALSQWSIPAYRARVVYVPQHPAWREGTVDAALRAPFAFRVRRECGFPDRQARTLLRAMGRDENFLQQRTERMSGGEAQIVAVVRALLVAPSVLLLDEPTASLDRGTVGAIEDLITHWVDASPDRAYIWTSHDRAQLERIAEPLLTLEPVS